MRRNPKASIDPIRASKRIAKAKNVMNPIVAIEAINKRNPEVAGSEVITRKTTVVPEIADESTMTKKIKASNKTADTKVLYTILFSSCLIFYALFYIHTLQYFFCLFK